MGMTMTQKILAAHAGLEYVEAGQLIEADLDLVLGNDITSPVAINEFNKIGASCVFDKDDNIIYSNSIDINLLLKIHSYLLSLPFVKKFKYLDSFGRNTDKFDDVQQVYVEVYFKNTLEMLKIKKALAPLTGIGILSVCYFYKNTLKTDGIKVISGLENLDKKDIYTIGNGNNDICMLREYNGFRVPYSYPKVIMQGFPKNSVCNLVRKIESDKI